MLCHQSFFSLYCDNENITITHLAECESDASYVRKGKMTSFTAVSSELKKGCLCQIPSDKESELIPFLQHYCEDKSIVDLLLVEDDWIVWAFFTAASIPSAKSVSSRHFHPVSVGH